MFWANGWIEWGLILIYQVIQFVTWNDPRSLEVTNNLLKGSRELTIPKRARFHAELPGTSICLLTIEGSQWDSRFPFHIRPEFSSDRIPKKACLGGGFK